MVFVGWFGGLAALHLILPGKMVQGVPLPNGSRLTYKLNGMLANTTHTHACAYLSYWLRHKYLSEQPNSLVNLPGMSAFAHAVSFPAHCQVLNTPALPVRTDVCMHLCVPLNAS